MENTSVAALVNALRQHALLEAAQLDAVVRLLLPRVDGPKTLAKELVRRGWLTTYQANLLLKGRGAELVLGSYVLLEPIGEGGMGQVFKARQRKLGRIDAVKVVRVERLSNPDAMKRFQREMVAAASLSHANVVHAFYADEDHGRFYIAMELLTGSDLSQLVQQKGTLPFSEACEYTRQAALGLQHAHERGLVHRDIKPHNLLLTDGNVIKVLDLGLARLAQTDDDGTLTATGAVMGTPDYIAPEQARQSHDVDGRADLYSLGCTLYFFLTGRPPFPDRPMAAKVAAHLFEQPVPVESLRPGTPPELAAVVKRLLAKKPEERFQSAGELATMLTKIGRELSTAAEESTGVWPDGAARIATAEARPQPLQLAQTAPPTAAPRRTARGLLLFTVGVFLISIFAGLIWLFTHGPLGADTSHSSAPPSGSSGTLVFQSEDSGARLLVHRKGQAGEPSEAKPGEPLTLEAGDYELQLKPAAAAGLRLAIHEASVQAGGQTTVHVEGAPISPWALVSRPATLDGVQSWTITTRSGLGGVNFLTYSPDGKLLAAVHEDNVVRLLTPSSDTARAFVVPGAKVRAIAWSPDKTEPTLAVADEITSVRVWSATTGRLIRALHVAANALAWSPDGKTLVCAVNTELQFFDVETGKSARPALTQSDTIHCLAWSPDGKTLAAAGEDGAVHLWRPPEWKEDVRKGHAGPVTALAWSPESTTLASAGRDQTIRRWLAVGFGSALSPIATGRKNLTALAWVTDKTGLAIASSGDAGSEGALQLWNPVTGAPIRTTGPTVHALLAIDQAPDRKTIAFGGYAHDIHLWDLKNDVDRLVIPGNIGDYGSAVSWSPDGKQLATSGWNFTVSLWKADTGELVRRAPYTTTDKTGAPDWGHTGKRLAYTCGDLVYIWNPLDARHYALPRVEATPRRLAFATEGGLLAVAYDDRRVRLWDVTAKVMKNSLDAGKGQIDALAWTPDGKFLAAGDDTGQIFLWEAATGTRLHEWSHSTKTISLAWSWDGKTLAAVGADGKLSLWDREGKSVGSLGGTRAASGPMAWMLDGKSLIADGEDHHLRVWDVETKEMRTAVRRGSNSRGGEFSPDCSLFASASRSWTVRLWETATGRPLGTLSRLDAGWLVLSEDGHYRAENKSVEKDVVYIVQTEEGQQMLSPEAFAAKYSWKNDPDKARLDTR